MVSFNAEALTAALRDTTRSIYKNDAGGDGLTVRAVRTKTEIDLGLDAGFFQEGEWKSRSKEIIKGYADELVANGGDGDPKEEAEPSLEKAAATKKRKSPTAKAEKQTPVKKGVKRVRAEDKAPPKKRQKKEVTPSDKEDEPSESSELSFPETAESSFGGSDSEAPKSKKKGAKGKVKTVPGKGKSKKNAPSSEEEDPSSDEVLSEEAEENDAAPPPKKQAPKKSAKPASSARGKLKKPVKVESEDEESEEDSKPTPKSSPKTLKVAPKSAETPTSDIEKPDVGANVTETNDSESEMSVVLDEPPARKRKSKAGTKSGSKPPAAAKPKNNKPAAAPKDLSPDEAQIKTLQSQLKKCGINKIWQFELKQYGDNSKAKIRHLNNALKEIGMTGRFSEARAKEIKELRELQADLEAVKEGEKNWGLESGRRASRAAAKKNFKESPASGEDEEESDEKANDDGSESEVEAVPRQRHRARQDLAFLDDDEEDSD